MKTIAQTIYDTTETQQDIISAAEAQCVASYSKNKATVMVWEFADGSKLQAVRGTQLIVVADVVPTDGLEVSEVETIVAQPVQRPLTLAQAKAQYPHRFTMEHVPAWAKSGVAPGQFYAPQYRTDAEWYNNTVFPGEGGLSKRSPYCQSNGATWPLGQWLAKPFAI